MQCKFRLTSSFWTRRQALRQTKHLCCCNLGHDREFVLTRKLELSKAGPIVARSSSPKSSSFIIILLRSQSFVFLVSFIGIVSRGTFWLHCFANAPSFKRCFIKRASYALSRNACPFLFFSSWTCAQKERKLKPEWKMLQMFRAAMGFCWSLKSNWS